MKNFSEMFKINRNITFLGIVSLLTDISSEMLTPVLPLFLSNVLKVDKAFIGLIEGVAESTASVLKIFSGWISDRFNKRKPLVLAGYGLSAMVKPILLIASSWQSVLLYRFLDRIGKGIRTSPRDAIIADSCKEDARGKAYGYHKMMDTIGAAIGPLIAFAVLAGSPGAYRTVFGIALIPGILAVITIILFVKDKPIDRVSKKTLPSFNLKMFSPAYSKFLLAAFLFTLAAYSDAFLALRSQNLGVPVKIIPLLFLYFNIIQALFAMPAGMLSDKLGRKKLLLAGYITFALMSIGFAFASKSYHAWFLITLNGLYTAMIGGAQRALVVDLVDEKVRGTALGTFHFLVGIAALPSGLLFGLLWDQLGVKSAFSIAAALAVIAGFLLVSVKEKS